ncbi:hypothetical protein Ciccas_004236 [Cichlidogyrus casuarinus]|uniref:Uncharacterized protein n=1 Tax=Cichlidogyrus casuarinus TaxID=1844966 RepID=A0ABD2QEF2_9PLAT
MIASRDGITRGQGHVIKSSPLNLDAITYTLKCINWQSPASSLNEGGRQKAASNNAFPSGTGLAVFDMHARACIGSDRSQPKCDFGSHCVEAAAAIN